MALTEPDIDQIRQIVKEEVAEQLTPFRSEMLDRFDEVIKEIRDSRQERHIVANKLQDHEDRLTTVEQKLNLSS